MTYQKKLMNLILRMSPSEKGYFIRFAKQHATGEKNNYLALFEFLYNKKVYNVSQIKKKFGKSKIPSRLSQENIYLYKMLLKALRAYNAERNVDQQIFEHISNAHILIDKGLYEQGDEEIDAGKELACRYERFPLLLYLLLLKRRTIHRNELNDSSILIEKAITESDETLQYVGDLLRIRECYDLAFIQTRSELTVRSNDKLSETEQLLEVLNLRDKGEKLSKTANQLFLTTMADIYHVLRNYSKSFEFRERAVEALENHPTLYENDRPLYILSLGNLGVAALRTKKLSVAEECINKLSEIVPETVAEKTEHFQCYNYLELLYHMNSFQRQKCLEVARSRVEPVLKAEEDITDFEKKIIANGLNLARRLTIAGNLSCIHFVSGNYADAQHWLKYILHQTKSTNRIDIQHYALLLLPVTHYHLGDISSVEKRYHSAYRRLSKFEDLYQFEKAVLRFVRALPDKADRSELVHSCEKLNLVISTFKKDNIGANLLGIFEITLWLKSLRTGVHIGRLFDEFDSINY